jgi:hypothetical protein
VTKEDLKVKDDRDRPNLIVLTAENDTATGTIFPMFRFVSTLFEKYAPEPTRQYEREANLHAIGFIDRYKTHRLCLKDNKAVLAAESPAGPETQPPRRSPVWVVKATPDIIDGHNGFLYGRNSTENLYLLEWLVEVYVKHGSELGQCNS